MNTPAQPEFFKPEHRTYLNELRESGKTNVFGARPYLMNKFPELSKLDAAQVLSYWMKSFGAQA